MSTTRPLRARNARSDVLIFSDAATLILSDAQHLRNLPTRTWQINVGWILAANIAADLTTWTHLLGLCDDDELRDVDPDTLWGSKRDLG
jgi:hypothetical protein